MMIKIIQSPQLNNFKASKINYFVLTGLKYSDGRVQITLSVKFCNKCKYDVGNYSDWRKERRVRVTPSKFYYYMTLSPSQGSETN